jgi:group I intron endonuclease
MESNSKSIYGISGIYQIVNLITEKRYVGYASNIGVRWNGHKYDLRNKKHGNPYLQKAWNKYGSENFRIKLLQECSKDKLCLYEDYWVKILKTEDREFGYNLKETDPNGKAGQSQETIEKLKISHKGRRPPQSTIDILTNYWKTHSKTEEQEANRIAALKKVDWVKVRVHKRKKVIDISNNTIYDSLKDASKLTGIPHRTLCRKLTGKGKNNTTYKYL